MRQITVWAACVAAAWGCGAQVTVTGPDGRVSAEVGPDELGRLSYRVLADGCEVLPCSPLGITVDGRDWGKGVRLGKPVFRSFREKYAVQGLHDTAVNRYREALIPLMCGDCGGQAGTLEFRVFDDGAAYRYRVPGKGMRTVAGESSAWVLPRGARVWYQKNVRDHEDVYLEQAAEEIAAGTAMGVPVTLKLAGKPYYLMLTEANLDRYSDMALRSAGSRILNAFFHADKAGWTLAGEVLSPWRVTLVARDLNTLANSDIVKNLCPPPSESLANAGFYKPGRAVWHWWSSGDPVLAEQREWYDRTRALGFEYYLIDDGWKKWRDGERDEWACLRDCVAYGKSVGVETAIWVHSKEVKTEADRLAYMRRVKESGVTGIKIDFMPAANREWVQWYEDTLRDAAAIGLFVDFHGATKPTGRERTWPHDLTREAVRGHEWHISRYKRTQPPSYDTILPFCRNVQGRADYTPTVFNPAELNGFTWARELAQAVVFHSPFLCYADNPAWYLRNPAVETFRAIPAVWNETRVLPGSEIGRVVAMAKRDRQDWFVGVINADRPQTLTIDCAFLGRGTFRMLSYGDRPDRDDAYAQEQRRVTRKERLTLELRKNGGFVAHFVKE
ncbi:MAG: glycoside hydrolase family 97 catalytic domain-containing protein [Kiritimatiellia bacterium]|jgi:alpha-glucosidase|nr:glycoside hydrolase family 97 catalytic domain-containing protein [Kiritimatiellia bacterium]